MKSSFYSAILILCCFIHLVGMDNAQGQEFTVYGHEIKLISRLVLASCCIKGHCVCPARWGQCKYLLAHNSYLEKKAQAFQPNVWHEEKRKSM